MSSFGFFFLLFFPFRATSQEPILFYLCPRVKRKGTDPRTGVFKYPLTYVGLVVLVFVSFPGNLLLTAIVLAFVLEDDDIFLRLFTNGVFCGSCQSCRCPSLRVFLPCGLLTPGSFCVGGCLRCSQAITRSWIWLPGYTTISFFIT